MNELFKLLLAPFFTVTNYSELLKKFAWFIFWETYIGTWFLRDISPLDQAFSNIEKFGALGKIYNAIPFLEKANAAGLAAALLVAVGTIVIQLHDRISDVLGVRRRFDFRNILLPLAAMLGSKLSATGLRFLEGNHDSLMRELGLHPSVNLAHFTPARRGK